MKEVVSVGQIAQVDQEGKADQIGQDHGREERLYRIKLQLGQLDERALADQAVKQEQEEGGVGAVVWLVDRVLVSGAKAGEVGVQTMRLEEGMILGERGTEGGAEVRRTGERAGRQG